MRAHAITFAAICGGLAGACAATPTVTRETTTMTPAQIAEMGLECRRETGIGTTIPRNVCASPEQWAEYEKRTIAGSKTYFDELRRAPNDRFNGR